MRKLIKNTLTREVIYLNITGKKKSHDFNIYYLNFSKVYEIAMMITFTYFQEADTRKGKQAETAGKIIKSNTPSVSNNKHPNKSNKNYHFVDTLAIIQDVAFKLEEVPALKLHWWNKFGIWLSTLWRK